MYAAGGAGYEEEAGENILNWIKEEPEVAAKPARYRSKFAGGAAVTSSFGQGKKSAGTFGRSRARDDPKKFLKAGSKTSKGVDPKSKPKKFRRAAPARKAPVPSRDDRPLYGLKTSKNFVVSNAVENILAAPQPRPAAEPDYLRKSDFGKTPAYLGEVKQEIEQEKEFIRTMLAEDEGAGDDDYEEVRELSEEDRAGLISALKAKWEEVNNAYQLITFKRISSSSSTIGAIRRKEECENQLAQLEKDIAKLEARGPIYVVDDAAY
mmetsp:Transcript_82784/g.200643  ORF Transcript_82784/g.200643 Transcript_82784/m.200643 type:complete len:265 (+) Transcript_82784:180-974(+)